MPRKSKVGLAEVLASVAAHLTLSQMAEKWGISHEAVRKRIKELELAGRIKALSRSPAFYEVLDVPIPNPTYPDGGDVEKVGGDVAPTTSDEARILELHRCGEVYDVKKGELPPGRAWRVRGSLICRQWDYRDIKLVGYVSPKGQRVGVWAKAFRGLRPSSQLTEARARMRLFLGGWAKEHGLELVFRKYAGPVELTAPAAHVGKAVIGALGLKDGPKVVGPCVWKAGSSSHPGKLHISSGGPGAPRSAAFIQGEQVVRVLERAPELSVLPEEVGRQRLALEKALEAIRLLSESREEPYVAPKAGARREVG